MVGFCNWAGSRLVCHNPGACSLGSANKLSGHLGSKMFGGHPGSGVLPATVMLVKTRIEGFESLILRRASKFKILIGLSIHCK